MSSGSYASSPAAAAAACETRDDDVEEGNDGIDDGSAGCAYGMHDRHDTIADCAED